MSAVTSSSDLAFFCNLVVTLNILGNIFTGIFLGWPLVFGVLVFGLRIELSVSGLRPVIFYITSHKSLALRMLFTRRRSVSSN